MTSPILPYPLINQKIAAESNKKPGRSISEKISRIQARLESILSQKPDLSKKEEIVKISQTLSELFVHVSPDDQQQIVAIQILADRAWEYSKTGSSRLVFSTKQVVSGIQDIRSINISTQNQEAIRYIDHLLKVLNHGLSSTKSNGYKTYGDGSFVAKIFRPFLQVLRNQIFSNPKIDASHASWQDIVMEYEHGVEDADMARVHFLGILKKSMKKGDFSDIFGPELLAAVREFSGSHFYKKDDKVALQNVLATLENNPPLGFVIPRKDTSEIE